MLRKTMPALLVVLALISCQKKAESQAQPATKDLTAPQALTLTSSAFTDGGTIPGRFTCDSADVSPVLAWSGVPKEAKSLALVVDDPDAPTKTWVHWVIYDIPPSDSALAENIAGEPKLPNGARQGINDFGKYGYGGPCPPSGVHRYFFKLYALDNVPDLPDKATKQQLLDAMKNHVLAHTQIIGTYAHPK